VLHAAVVGAVLGTIVGVRFRIVALPPIILVGASWLTFVGVSSDQSAWQIAAAFIGFVISLETAYLCTVAVGGRAIRNRSYNTPAAQSKLFSG
jgi:hypothetical protein